MTAGLLLALAVVGPLACALGAGPSRRGLDSGSAWVGLGAAIGLLVEVADSPPVRLLDGWISVDRLGALWLVFVLFTTMTVRRFAMGSLAADPHRERFLRVSAVAGAASAVLVVAGNLWALTVASALTGLAATVVLRHGETAAARIAASGARRVFLLGDLTLLAAAVVVAVSLGSTEFGVLGEATGATREVAAVLVVVAALLRCAQLPSHRWLARSLSAPTPASALLHAGVVNGGGVVLVRSAALTTASTVATMLCVGVATAGIVAATAVMRTRADIKGRLVWSTIGQMGFMLVQAGLGLTAAAGLHLVAHGMYKSSLFLGSGTGLEHAPHRRAGAPTTSARVSAAVLTVLAVAAAVEVSGFAPLGADGGNLLIVGFAVLTAFQVFLAGIARRGAVRSVVALGVSVATLASAYFLALTLLETWLELPTTEVAGAGAIALAVIGVCIFGGLVSATAGGVPRRIAVGLDARVRALGRAPHVPGYVLDPAPGARS